MSKMPGTDLGPRIIVALDYDNAYAAEQFLERLDQNLCRVKIGKQLFTSAGPDLVRRMVEKGFDVFLDLKFHDIPNTVAGACAAAADLGVWMLNVHASGGTRMLEAARKAVSHDGPLLIAVSVLTSMSESDLHEVGVERTLPDQVSALAELSFRAGMDGMVCSAHEATMLKQRFGARFRLVTPGIRYQDDGHDQRRIMTPQHAVEAGSDYLVIGRSITGAEDPLAVLHQINQQIGAANDNA